MKKLLIVNDQDLGTIKRVLMEFEGRYLPHEVEHKEITLPTEDEIEKEKVSSVRHLPDGSISTDDDDMAYTAGVCDGIAWYCNEILKQLK